MKTICGKHKKKLFGLKLLLSVNHAVLLELMLICQWQATCSLIRFESRAHKLHASTRERVINDIGRQDQYSFYLIETSVDRPFESHTITLYHLRLFQIFQVMNTN